ncbi:DUF418 domain-containing protein [Telluria aromaticivorans]|uniref:DUF418 domain-containing protein n=1 Tax=Telluria aromaticivorans TaxID=2725995 RepID=A0A7Y2K375_9BURK|nr:DUF418 domain-containing protein [Telluria aromaticivorans]NNG25876.1 DUF418 domain-containing protein [Telluria aromaticivorans]
MDQTLAPVALTPVTSDERIQSLDVVRGFALIGILLMNVEFFNRATAAIGSGMQTGLTGANYWVSYFVQYFVTGKFWTIFSLLFGMGFAVMLMRAERAGRSFLVPYMRRIAALAVFGALHHVFLFAGDILFSYAVAATALLVVLYGRFKWIVLAMALCIGGGFIPHMDWLFGIAGGLAFFGLAAWWLRGEQRMKRFGKPPVIAFVHMLAGAIAAIAGAVSWAVPDTPPEARFGLALLGFALLTLGYLTMRYHADKAGRPWRLGVGIYCFAFFMMTGAGASMYFFPEKPAAVMTTAEAKKEKEAAAERAKARREREARIREETAVLSKGSYTHAVTLRTGRFGEHAAGEVGFATILIGMFLIGTWFVRAGIMEKASAHLPLFRKLALYGLPFGIGMGLLGSAIAMHPVPGSRGADGWQLAMGLQMLGNLPASLGYVSVVILMLHSASPLNKVRVLAPFGRMALTNYLTQSVVASTFFFGYGFGNWGMSRVEQMLFVVVLAAAQIVFSHVWLSRFRYGPMEWLWRAVTYWQVPPMRIKTPAIMPAVVTPA